MYADMFGTHGVQGNGKFERIMFDTRTLLQEQRFHEHLRIYIVKKNTLRT